MRAFIFGAALLTAIATANSAAAEGETIGEACKKDVASYCKDSKGVALCMAENRAKLSMECKAAIGEKTLERQAKDGHKK